MATGSAAGEFSQTTRGVPEAGTPKGVKRSINETRGSQVKAERKDDIIVGKVDSPQIMATVAEKLGMTAEFCLEPIRSQ